MAIGSTNLQYPTAVDVFATWENDVDTVTAEMFNNLQSSIVTTQTELGASPSGSYSTVVERLNAIDSAIAGGPGSVGSYTTSFVDGDLTAGILTVTHSLSEQYVLCQVYNDSDQLVVPDDITLSSTSALAVDLSSFGTISGTWNVVVFKP